MLSPVFEERNESAVCIKHSGAKAGEFRNIFQERVSHRDELPLWEEPLIIVSRLFKLHFSLLCFANRTSACSQATQ